MWSEPLQFPAIENKESNNSINEKRILSFNLHEITKHKKSISIWTTGMLGGITANLIYDIPDKIKDFLSNPKDGSAERIYLLALDNDARDVMHEFKKQIQMVINHSLEYRQFLIEINEENDNIDYFIDTIVPQNRDIIRNHSSDDQYTPFAYDYIMNPKQDCTFVEYAYFEFMKRINGSGLETCKLPNFYDMALSLMYQSTGLQTFVNTLVLGLDINKDGKPDLILGTAIDWDKVSYEIHPLINVENTRYVIVDRNNNIVLDCDEYQCNKIKDYVNELEGGDVTASSPTKQYYLSDYSEFDNYQIYPFDNEKLNIDENEKVLLLEGWKLIVHYDDYQNWMPFL